MECQLRVGSLSHENRKRNIRERKRLHEKKRQHPNQTCWHIYNAPEAAPSLTPQVKLS